VDKTTEAILMTNASSPHSYRNESTGLDRADFIDCAPTIAIVTKKRKVIGNTNIHQANSM
jgi:hypothetical protein